MKTHRACWHKSVERCVSWGSASELCFVPGSSASFFALLCKCFTWSFAGASVLRLVPLARSVRAQAYVNTTTCPMQRSCDRFLSTPIPSSNAGVK